MSRLTDWLEQVAYPRHKNNCDDELLRKEILTHRAARHSILDFGAERDKGDAMNLRESCASVSGVDISLAVLKNPFLDIARALENGRIPFPDESVDIVQSDSVLEHLQDPVSTFGEIHRALRPRGAFIGKAPHKHHCMPLVASITPTWFHKIYNGSRGRESSNTIPTIYRADCEVDLRRQAPADRMAIEKTAFVEGRPEYLRMTFLTYLAKFAYERFVKSFELFSRFRCVSILVMIRTS